jgi:hypothetical protein
MCRSGKEMVEEQASDVVVLQHRNVRSFTQNGYSFANFPAIEALLVSEGEVLFCCLRVDAGTSIF